MGQTLTVVRDLARLRRLVAKYRGQGESVALVPTMGALHDGHISLVRAGRRRAKRVVVSIFVNPTQFAPTEDFASYPRTFEADVAALRDVGADVVWNPPVEVMYPADFVTRIVPAGPATAGLEDASRPHFFGGVATIVCKLLLQCLPDIAVFGEKDYQQLKVVTQMAKDLNIPTRIFGAPTVREKDGLAMSSRNAYLSAEERKQASLLYQVLRDCAARIGEGEKPANVLGTGRKQIARGGFALDYLELRDAETLAPVSGAEKPLRLLVAAKLGATRLIDNIAVPKPATA
ncbi:MAG: pantoate--beta-alanine ligase [Variibacter sp.]